MNPYFPPDERNPEIEIRTEAEADEFYSYIGDKGNQRRTRYAAERSSGAIFARHNGGRTDESCPLLMKKLSVFRVTRYYTDDLLSYRKCIPLSKHIVGKADTRRTERKNLNFRTHIRRLNRKTICFSKDEKIGGGSNPLIRIFFSDISAVS